MLKSKLPKPPKLSKSSILSTHKEISTLAHYLLAPPGPLFPCPGPATLRF